MSFYTEAQRALQDTHESRPLADAVAAAVVADTLSDDHRAFIASRDYFFLSTVNAQGEPTVSYKGGDPGTVQALDAQTLVFPAYDGNGMFLSLGNITDTAKIGLLFMDFETPQRLRVQATASLDDDPALKQRYPGAIAVVRARVDAVFINCARYIHPHQRTGPSPYVPDAQGAAPFPAWKRIETIQPFLPPGDQGVAERTGGTIDEAEYARLLLEGKS
ncbi:MAG: pyridoxamine 5'-phosphate oxidase family protein [Pseudomonadota bacterium]